MRRWTARKQHITRFAGRLAMSVCMLATIFGNLAIAADSEPVADNPLAAAAEVSKRQLKSKSSQSQQPSTNADSKRSKVNLPTGEDTAPTVMVSKGLRGNASFYSPRFQGRKTASGDIFNNKLFTAASNLFPLGTLVAVKRPDSNLCVIVKVNDRMHARHRARVIDLSHSAAKYLDMVRDGVVKVQIVKVPANAVEGATIDCAMGYELEEACDDCNIESAPATPLQFKD